MFASVHPIHLLTEISLRIIYDYHTLHPFCCEVQASRAYVLLTFSFLNIFRDFCQTSYLNIYRTDLHEICRIVFLSVFNIPKVIKIRLIFDRFIKNKKVDVLGDTSVDA